LPWQRQALRRSQQRPAQAFAGELEPVVGDLRRRGLSLLQMAAELTAQGFQTPCGGEWSACAVRNVLRRLEAC
jgi:hypothetical protein